ncbi:hypothetical protein ABW20_dc0101877 [Dactylellina cionopaga]|nr:hypothetical protein ABW20_dc0101877 [Dactylellina cionopaga]
MNNSVYSTSKTVAIKCADVKLGDIIILLGRECQVTKIFTRGDSGQHSYIGNEIFTRLTYEQKCISSNGDPHHCLAPKLAKYRVLHIEDGFVTCTTESGEVKQGLGVANLDGLLKGLINASEAERGASVLVLNHGGKEVVVGIELDTKDA